MSVKRVRSTKWPMFKTYHDQAGQNLIEYAMVAAVVSAAIIAMSTYVFRSVQATQQTIQTEFSKTE